MSERVKVLCTGAGGFIGRHLVRYLLRKNREVWCLLGPKDDPSEFETIDVRLVSGDLTEPGSLKPLAQPYSYIYHLGALTKSTAAGDLDRVNFDGTRTLVRLFLSRGLAPRRFLFTSSIAAVGPSAWGCPHRESSPCLPVSEYGWSKYRAERFLLGLGDRFPATVVRLPLVYGPGSQGGLFAYFRLINRGISLSLGRAEATVGYVDDIVRGMVLAAENPRSSGQVYFLGESRSYRSEEVVRIIERSLRKRALKIRIPYCLASAGIHFLERHARRRNRRPGVSQAELEEYLKYRSWLAAVDKAASELKYRTEIPLEAGARKTAQWYLRSGLL